MAVLTDRPFHKCPRDTFEIHHLPSIPMTSAEKTAPHPWPTETLHPLGQRKAENHSLHILQLAKLSRNTAESAAHAERERIVASVAVVFAFGESLAQIRHRVAAAVVYAVLWCESADHGEGELGVGVGCGGFVVRGEVVGFGVFEQQGRAVGEETEGVVAVGV